MKIRGHGNGVAIALSAVAVVFAASGTAYAVTASVVNIADPTTPSRIAKVDAAGRLTTVGPSSSFNIVGTSFASPAHFGDLYSAPTAATLAVTKFSVTALAATTASFSAYLFQVPVIADGTCSTSTTTKTLAFGTIAPGASGGQDFTTPLVVAPSGGAKYCLDVFYTLISGTASGSEDFGLQVTGYATAGKYTGVGATTADVTRSKAAAVAGR